MNILLRNWSDSINFQKYANESFENLFKYSSSSSSSKYIISLYDGFRLPSLNTAQLGHARHYAFLRRTHM